MMKSWDYSWFKWWGHIAIFKTLGKPFSGRYSWDQFLAHMRKTVSMSPFWQSLPTSIMFLHNPHIQELFLLPLEKLFPNIPQSMKFDHPLLIILARNRTQQLTTTFSAHMLCLPAGCFCHGGQSTAHTVGGFILGHWQAKKPVINEMGKASRIGKHEPLQIWIYLLRKVRRWANISPASGHEEPAPVLSQAVD